MLAGMGMVFVVVLRIAWSLVGNGHARLTDLARPQPGLAGRSELSAFFLEELLPPQ